MKKGLGFRVHGIVHLKKIEYWVYGDLILMFVSSILYLLEDSPF